jgi:hypothetical protein
MIKLLVKVKSAGFSGPAAMIAEALGTDGPRKNSDSDEQSLKGRVIRQNYGIAKAIP